MDVLSITEPSFLKQLTIPELEALSADIRTFLIQTLAATGGHIGPNLGVVELTIALHRAFNSPDDKLIWDVGHQAYVHKILTGRAGQFGTLRQHKGLCGFPKRCESPHDVWETGHSSTSLSAAMGMAAARDIRKEHRYVVPIIGDGALTGGMALEALNHIGAENISVTVILNDNEMSIAPNVGALHNVLGKLRTAGEYKQGKKDLEYLLRKIPAIGGKVADAAERVKDSLKYLLVDGVFFEELGFTYFGPIDGHDLQLLDETLALAKKTSGPVLVHVVTKKGKGYLPAELDRIGTWHGTGPYKMETGDFPQATASGPPWSLLIAEAVRERARTDNRIVAITPAMPVGSRLEGFAAEFPERFFDVGIAEQHAVTMAGGLAQEGMKPFVAIYSTFLQRAYDQVLHDVCRQNLNVFFGIDRAGLVGADGETHQGVFDISFLRHLPNLVLMMPKDENEARDMVCTALAYNGGPIALRFPRGNGYAQPEDRPMRELPIGSWEVLREGEDACVLAFGTTIPMALEAADELAREGRRVGVINARFLKPLDAARLRHLAQAGIPLLTIEESMLEGGFGSAVLEFFETAEIAAPPIRRMGIPDQFVEHGAVESLLADIGLTRERAIESLRTLIDETDRDGGDLR